MHLYPLRSSLHATGGTSEPPIAEFDVVLPECGKVPSGELRAVRVIGRGRVGLVEEVSLDEAMNHGRCLKLGRDLPADRCLSDS